MKLRITEHCKLQGITLQDLADKLNIARSTLANTISNGNPTIGTLENIAKALDVSVFDLIDEEKSNDDKNTIICPKCGTKFRMEE